MNDLTTFSNPEFGQVRTVEINGTPWLVGKDVAVALGYKNPQRAIRDHVDTEDQGVTKTVTPSGEQEMLIINESGLYSLILSSKMPKAKAFKHWVTSEVLHLLVCAIAQILKSYFPDDFERQMGWASGLLYNTIRALKEEDDDED